MAELANFGKFLDIHKLSCMCIDEMRNRRTAVFTATNTAITGDRQEEPRRKMTAIVYVLRRCTAVATMV